MAIAQILPTIASARQRLINGELSSRALVEACLDNIRSNETVIRAFTLVTEEGALKSAELADKLRSKGKIAGGLDGIPFTLKDVIETAGIFSTAQSRSLADYIPENDARVATKILEAGGILLGKSATWEFAHGGPAWDVLQEPTRNPWNVEYDPSGSSSGAAAGIAAGFTLGALGTDTGGSIRGPASVCGVAGLKPTYGLVSCMGVIPNSYSQDHVGPLAWTAEDVAIILENIADLRPLDRIGSNVQSIRYVDSINRDITGIKIGIPRKWFQSEVIASDAVQSGFEEALKVLSDLGAKLVPIDLPSLQSFDDVKKIIAAVELFATHAKTLRERPESVGEVFRVRVMGGALVRAESYLNAHRVRKVLAQSVQVALTECDAFALPAGEPAQILTARPAEQFFAKADYLSPFNVSGNPAISVRAGFNNLGLPLSIQFVGRLFEETTILNIAHRYECHTAWREMRPSFFM